MNGFFQQMLTQSDRSQLGLMRHHIHRFEQQIPTLDSLLSITRSLEELLGSLQAFDNKWIEEFRTHWWELEFTSSLMMDEEREDLIGEDVQSITIALKNMKIIINEVLDKNQPLEK